MLQMEDYNQTSKCNDLQMNQRGMSNHTYLQQFHKCGFQEAEYGMMYQNWRPEHDLLINYPAVTLDLLRKGTSQHT